MNWYPWLNSVYRQIIMQYQDGYTHHALLIQALPGIGDKELIWAISRWLMCQNHDGIKSCGQCHSCQLMIAGTHPDWYQLRLEKGRTTPGVGVVREISNKLLNHAQQGGAKIVWLSNADYLSDIATNSLLKILEEPPFNVWFFLSSSDPSRLLPTIRSRCLRLHLAPPDEQQSLIWLQKRYKDSTPEQIRTALRLSSGAPGAALILLEPKNWAQRQKLCNTLSIALEKDLLILLSQLNHENVDTHIIWLVSFLMDALKWHNSGENFLTNIDHLQLIQQLAQRLSTFALHKSLSQWLLCRDYLNYVVAINRELLLTDLLLSWEALFKSSS